MKQLIYACAILGLVACGTNGKKKDQVKNDTTANKTSEMTDAIENANDFYAFKTETLSGELFEFSALRGKRVLIVNTASECGYTPQYEQLQELYEANQGKNFTILGFPSNDFGGQEPGSNEDIKAFCKKNYGVNFMMMAKSTVMGAGQNDVYKWLTRQDENGVSDAEVKWNFNKFLIDESGKWVAYYPSSVSPLDEKIVGFVSGK